MKKQISFLLMILTAIVLLAACGEEKTPAKKEEAVPTDKTLIVGTEIPYAPFEYEENGVLTGFDIEIMQAIAVELKWKIEFKKDTFDNVFAKVKDGSYDIGIAALTASEERKKDYGFSNPYFSTYQLIIVKDSSNATQLEDLKEAKIAAQEGTTGIDFVQQELGADYDKIVPFANMEEAIESFIKGESDAMVGDNAFILDYLKQHPDVKGYTLIRDNNVIVENLSIMVAKEKDALAKELNKGLEKIEENGKFDAIYSKYFGE